MPLPGSELLDCVGLARRWSLAWSRWPESFDCKRMRAFQSLAVSACFCSIAFAEQPRLEGAIEDGFSDVRTLKSMHSGMTYSVPLNGVTESGPGDQFLRRRNATEIATSKLSCGCGDNALVFLDHLERNGFETLLVDGAEISSLSLLNTFSGHAVVAVRERGVQNTNRWCLVDSTNLRIISQDWSPENRTFEAFGRLFWIGYCGSVAEYPVHNPEELKTFYTATLRRVPQSILASALVALKMDIDPSLVNPDGSLVNPQVLRFVHLQEGIFKDHSVTPTRKVRILLKRGGDDAHTDVSFSEPAGWVAHVGTQSACSPSLLDYFEARIQTRFNQIQSDTSIPSNKAMQPAPL